MGQFSWLDCQTGKQIIDNKEKKVYLLVPEEFGGGHIEEDCYDGYGNFGGHDVYDLVAEWNRSWLSNHPEFVLPHDDKMVSDCFWYDAYANLDNTPEDVVKITKEEWRCIGIRIACYDEDNASLSYPIKITYDPTAVYEFCMESASDPNQGWESDDDWYCDDEEVDYVMATCRAVDNAFSKSEKTDKITGTFLKEIENIEYAFYTLLERMYENMPDCPDEYANEVSEDVENALKMFKDAVKIIKEKK